VKHDPNNPNCDRVMYGGAPDTMCTCDVDRPEDAPQPSTVMPAHPMPTFAPAGPGNLVLTGARARTHAELEAAGRELDAARKLLEPAQARFKAALDAHMAELLR
jgi:hypothetical protein